MKNKKQNYKYIQEYNKKNYKEFRVWLDLDSYNILINHINLYYGSKSQFIKDYMIEKKLIDKK